MTKYFILVLVTCFSLSFYAQSENIKILIREDSITFKQDTNYSYSKKLMEVYYSDDGKFVYSRKIGRIKKRPCHVCIREKIKSNDGTYQWRYKYCGKKKYVTIDKLAEVYKKIEVRKFRGLFVGAKWQKIVKKEKWISKNLKVIHKSKSKEKTYRPEFIMDF